LSSRAVAEVVAVLEPAQALVVSEPAQACL
jgi:hypothetical protein